MSTEAWLLHKIPSGDTSLTLHLFSREYGRFSCVYRGGRLPKKQAIVQPLIPLWLTIHSSRGWHYVRHVEAIANSVSLNKDALFSALYMNELIQYLLPINEPYPELYERYQYTLQGLSLVTERLALEALLRQFEWLLLRCCGYALTAPPGVIIPPAHMQAIIQGEFVCVEVLKSAKRIMRQTINTVLEGKALQSRLFFR
jgi:DNA repair protein RecO (recombination protein O)